LALLLQLVLCASAETPSPTSAETSSANCLGSQGAYEAQLSDSQHEPTFQCGDPVGIVGGDDVTLLQKRGLDKSLEKDVQNSKKANDTDEEVEKDENDVNEKAEKAASAEANQNFLQEVSRKSWPLNCPKTQILQNFNMTRYLGVWYELGRDKETTRTQKWYEYALGRDKETTQRPLEKGECSRVMYTDTNENKVNVENFEIPLSALRDDGTTYPEAEISIKGTAEQLNPEKKEGILGVKYYPNDPWDPFEKYTILDTDYENFSIVHSCTADFFGSRSWNQNWIFARESLNEDDDKYANLIAKAKRVLEENNQPDWVFNNEMRPTIQGRSKGCPIY